jgi:uncharacterized protein
MTRPFRPLRRAFGTAALVLVAVASPPCPAVAAAQSAPVTGAGEPGIPAPVGFVNDRAGLIDEPRRAQLEAFLDQLRRKTGAEFAVLTVPTTAPLDPAEYKVRVFERWGLGRKGRDDGLLLLVAVAERRIWFETGYGLEGTLPDGLQARIIREEMTPRFRAGDWSGGITAAVLRSAERIARERGVTLEWNGRELRYTGRGPGRGWVAPLWTPLVILLIAMILVIILASGRHAMSPGRRYRRGWGPWYGGWGGGFGGGGGGFGGGGSSFGGFGGGASGGGGGGGRW